MNPRRSLCCSVENLEVKAEFACDGTRADEVRPAEGREKVVERFFVGQVNDGDACAPSESITMKQVVVAYRQIE